MTRTAPNTVPLGEVATFERTGVAPAGLPAETIYIGLEHIERGGRILGHETVGSAAPASTKFRFTPHHVLFGKLRPNLGKIARPNFAGICSTDIIPIRPGNHLDRGYLAHYLAQPSMIDFAASRATGANLPRLSPTVLATFAIPLPSLDEQRRIAAILDHTDTLRAKRRQALAHLDSLPQAIFHRMFGDPDDATAAVPFGDIATLSGGRNLVADDSSADSAYRVLKISAVTTGQFRPEESKPLPSDYTPPTTHLVRQGDLLMSRANTAELVGAVAYVHSTPDSLALPDKVWRFAWRDPHSSPLFYQALMQTPTIRRRISRLASGTGGSMKNISKAKLDQMPVPHVEICRQQEFARLVCDVKQRRAKTVAAVATHDALFASLQTRAFKGEL